jgi:hypothetical protein
VAGFDLPSPGGFCVPANTWEGSLFNLVYAIAVGDFDLQEEFSAYYEPQSKQIQGVTPTMVAKQMKSTTKAVSDGLTSIGFEVERKAIMIHNKDDGSERKRVIRCYVVPSEKAWDEMVARYYYHEDEGEENIQIPDVLKSRKFVSVNASIASNASMEPLMTRFVDAFDAIDASAHTEKKDNAKLVKPCHICGSTNFWLRPDGSLICGWCHPKPAKRS